MAALLDWGKRQLKKLVSPITDALDFLGDIRDKAGMLEDEVMVTVSGNHLADKKTLHFLAAAVAFGIIKRLVPAGAIQNPFPSPGIIGIEYDATAKEITFIIRYRQNVSTIVTVGRGGSSLSLAPVFNGPLDVPTGTTDSVTGGPWDFTLGRVGALVGVVTPTLPLTGRVILTDRANIVTNPLAGHPNPSVVVPPGTNIPTPNPRPVGDARSRGTLTWMVWQSLANPCESLDGLGTQVYTAPNNTNRFTGG